jgi:hypothetical protein
MSTSDQSFTQEGAEIATIHSFAKEPRQENLQQEYYLASTTSSTIFLQSIFLLRHNEEGYELMLQYKRFVLPTFL